MGDRVAENVPPTRTTRKATINEADKENNMPPKAKSEDTKKQRLVSGATSKRVNINAKSNGKGRGNENYTKKLPEGSPENTSDSPSTPPQKVKPAAKRVTPIPSYVVTNSEIDVSPLFGSLLEDYIPQVPVARRGLFDGHHDVPSPHAKNAEASAEPKSRCKPAEPAPELAGNTKMASRRNQVETKASKKVNSSSSKAKKELTSATSSVAVKHSAPNLIAGEASEVAKAKSTSNVSSSRPPTTKSTSRPAVQRPQKQNENVKNCDPILEIPRSNPGRSSVARASSRKALKEVFEEERRKAREFLDEVCGPRANDIVEASQSNGMINKDDHLAHSQ